MKKILLSFVLFSMICSVSNANCDKNCTKVPQSSCYEVQEQYDCQKEKSNCKDSFESKKYCKDDCKSKNNDKYLISDDEYCIYNQCFFDKQYRKMKKELCLSDEQEKCIDIIYKKFKSDMEILYTKYRIQKNILLDKLACGNDCIDEDVENLKDIRRYFKENLKDYKSNLKLQLCKEQCKKFNKFIRHEKRTMKKIIKYGAVYKFPCTKCCK